MSDCLIIHKPDEVEVTPGMLEAGRLAFYGELNGWDGADKEDQDTALRAIFIAMLTELLSPGDKTPDV